MTNEELLQQAKDQVAEFAGWSDWNAFESAYRAAIKNYNESPGIKKYISDYRTLSDRAAMIAIQSAREEAKVNYFNSGSNYGYTAGHYDASSGHDRRLFLPNGVISHTSENIDKLTAPGR